MSTEIADRSTADIDLLTIRQIMERINQQDEIPHQAVKQALPDIEPVVEFIVAHFPRGGRILYVAAGTSGRIAVMDAAECPPTFGIAPDRVQVCMAGGEKAIFMRRKVRRMTGRRGAEPLPSGMPEKTTV